MSCDYKQDIHGCVQFMDWKDGLEKGCRYPCFVLGSYEPEKIALEQRRITPVKTPDKIKKAPPELELEPIGTPVVVQPPLSMGEAEKPPISEENPLLGAFLIAAVSSIGIPLLKDWVKSKIKKKDSDQPIECKPAQIKTNKQIKSIMARLEAIEEKKDIHLDLDELGDIKKRIERLEKKDHS